MICRNCKKKISGSPLFCPHCGTMLTSAKGEKWVTFTGDGPEETTDNSKKIWTAPPRKPFRLIAACLAAVATVILLFCIIGTVSNHFNKPSATAPSPELPTLPPDLFDSPGPVDSELPGEKPSQGPDTQPVGVQTLVAGELAQDPLSYSLTPDCVYIQNPQDYFGDGLTFKKNSHSDGYTIWTFKGGYDAIKAYMDVLCGTGCNLRLVDSYFQEYASSFTTSGGTFCSWLADYTGTGSVTRTTGVPFIDGKRANVGVYASSNRAGGDLEIKIYIPDDLTQVDLGLRLSGGNVSTGVGSGTSALAGLYKMPDGSFQTTDGRLSAQLGQATVLRDGETCSAPTEMVLEESTRELWVRDFYRSEMLYFSAPKNGVASGDLYTMQDILLTAWWGSNNSMATLRSAEDFGGYRWSLCLGAGHNGSYILPTYLDSNQFENILVRVLHYEEGVEAVYYIYAAFNTQPRVIEALCAVDLTQAIDGTDKPVSGGGSGQCWYCGGSGRCPTCGGSGRVTKWVPGTLEYLDQNCTDCYSPGKCRICGGSGE